MCRVVVMWWCMVVDVRWLGVLGVEERRKLEL